MSNDTENKLKSVSTAILVGIGAIAAGGAANAATPDDVGANAQSQSQSQTETAAAGQSRKTKTLKVVQVERCDSNPGLPLTGLVVGGVKHPNGFEEVESEEAVADYSNDD